MDSSSSECQTHTLNGEDEDNDFEHQSVTIDTASQSIYNNDHDEAVSIVVKPLISDSDTNNTTSNNMLNRRDSSYLHILPKLIVFKIFSILGILLHFFDIGLDLIVLENFRYEAFKNVNSSSQAYRNQFRVFFGLGLLFMTFPMVCLFFVGLAERREWKCERIHEICGKIFVPLCKITFGSVFNFGLLKKLVYFLF